MTVGDLIKLLLERPLTDKVVVRVWIGENPISPRTSAVYAPANFTDSSLKGKLVIG